MLRKQETSILTLMLLGALATTYSSLSAVLAIAPALAQSPSPTAFPLPTTLPNDLLVKIDGSSSMTVINESLKNRFENQYQGTTVELAADGTNAALEALLDGQIDLAAVGRPLTDAEKSQGLIEVPISREKIAIIVGDGNPFNGNLTFEQFARMFRGEITDWSQVGGAPGPVRFVDRPDTSDTRLALSRYAVFQAAPFQSGATTTQVTADDTAAVIRELGSDGISYAIASQVLNQDGGIKIVSMHNTLPDDPKYPYSQPRGYVYKAAPSPAVLAFLGFATSSVGQDIIAQARQTEATVVAAATPSVNPSGALGAPASPGASSTLASPNVAAASPDAASPDAASPGAASPGAAAAPSAAQESRFPLWWLLPLLALLGGLLWFFKGRRSEPAPSSPSAAIPPVVPPIDPAASPVAAEAIAPPDGSAVNPPSTVPVADLAVPGLANGNAMAAAGAAGAAGAIALGAVLIGKTAPKSRIILTPRRSDDAYAYWEAPEAHKAELRQKGGQDLTLRVYDVTDIDLNRQPAHSTQDYSVADLDQDHHVPIPAAERDYLAEIGYLTPDQKWLALARSNTVRVPATIAPLLAVASAPDPAIAAGSGVVTEMTDDRAIAPTGIAPTDIAPTDIVPTTTVSAAASTIDFPVSTPEANMIPSTPDTPLATPVSGTPSPVETDTPPIGAMLAGGAALVAGAAALGMRSTEEEQSLVEATKFDLGQTDLSREALADVDEGLVDLPEGYGESRIILMPRDPQWGYTYWDIPNEHRETVRQQGGQRLALRLYDVTGLDMNSQQPHSLQQYDCDELSRSWYVPIPVSDRDYLAEIGYLTASGAWLLLARSNSVRIPPIYPSDWFEDQFMTLDWNNDLQSRTFLALVPPAQRITAVENPLYDEIFDMAQSADAMRLAGSLFGSMQQVSSSLFGSMHMVSGSALASMTTKPIPTGFVPSAVSSYVFTPGIGMSGIGMSGIGMSGIGMSGIGLGASMPPLRARKFWLVADAELIVYGVTEPDATVTIAGQPIKLNPDGTFRFHMSFQDGLIDFPILAVAVDGVQTRSVHMKFDRNTPERRTNTKDEAVDESY